MCSCFTIVYTIQALSFTSLIIFYSVFFDKSQTLSFKFFNSVLIKKAKKQGIKFKNYNKITKQLPK
jgi:hypothetical protein